MKTVTIYTDGACVPNPGPGGWGAVLRYGAKEKDLCGGTAEHTTNNRMELTAPIEALETLNRAPLVVKLYTDSGEEMTLNRGKTYFALVDDDEWANFSYQ